VSAPQFAWGRQVLDRLELAGNEVVLDAGSGTGRLTALLAERLPEGRVVAIDRSENMSRAAAKTLSPFNGRVQVLVADLLSLPFAPSFDAVFSTATFHWVLDHDTLFAGIRFVLRLGGRLCAQCGGGPNLERLHERAERLMTDEPRFAAYFRDWQNPWRFADVPTTVARLERIGFEDIRVWLEESPVTFPDAPAFKAFASTVVLRTHLARLPSAALRGEFADAIAALAERDSPPFTLDYWRLNIDARRAR
jgi:trans-aconitate methyltransferase